MKMQRSLLILLLLLTQIGEAQFSDHFLDSNFSVNPSWTGDTNDYEVDAAYQLHLNAVAQTDTSYLSTPSKAIKNGVWEFLVKFNFNPSSSNYAKIYLVASKANLKTALDGYFVKLGNTADEVSLYRQDGFVETKVIDGVDKRLNTSNVVCAIKVTRDSLGNWQLFSDTTGGVNYILEGSGRDTTYNTSSYFGVFSRYTSTRSDRFYYDNFNVSGSEYVDYDPPKIDSVVIVSTNELDVYFNEEVEISSSQANLNYIVDLGIGIPVNASRDVVNGALVHLTFTSSFTNGSNYLLTVKNVKDTANNSINIIVEPFTYLVLYPPEQNDVLINEVLFNPFVGGSDFVEIYNNSNKIINLEGWSLANLERDSIDNYQLICDTTRLMFPSEFVLLSKDVYNVSMEYLNSVETAFLKMDGFPSYNNDEGDVYLIDPSNQIIDHFHYDEDMHFPLINNPEGVSLERTHYDRPTNELTNWHSASEAVGYATPGFENSQFQKQKEGNEEVTINPLTFSPDNDGVDDLVNISYRFPNPGFVGNVIVYDAKGRLVKKLIQNQLLSVKGAFSWDGINDNNEKAGIGLYVIYMEVFNLQGNVESFKRTVVLASHL